LFDAQKIAQGFEQRIAKSDENHTAYDQKAKSHGNSKRQKLGLPKRPPFLDIVGSVKRDKQRPDALT
jgi:hypothetical protein